MMYFLAPFLFCLGLTLGVCCSVVIAVTFFGLAAIFDDLISSKPVQPDDIIP